MSNLITRQEALEHVRIDDESDPIIDDYIAAASAAIRQYIGDGVYLDKEACIIREDVKNACRMLVGDFYRYREATGTPMDTEAYGFLPRYVTALLFPYRNLVSK